MKDRELDQLLRTAAPPPTRGTGDFSAGLLGRLHGENPWLRDWRRFLVRWVPLGLLLVILLALAVALLPHGEHEPASAATTAGEEP